MAEQQPEPWLRGPLPGVDPAVAMLLYSLKHAREDLEKFTGSLTQEQIWNSPHGLAPIGFQIRHIAGSLDRLLTYLEGRQLSDEQLSALKEEKDPTGSRAELLAQFEEITGRVERAVEQISPDHFGEFRGVGRKQLPTTVIGLIIHMAEHTQRHVGQAIVTAKVVQSTH